MIRIDGLAVDIGGRRVLDVPRLTLAAGERLALIGANGAGKSTLLRVLGGFTAPSSGRVEVLGRPLSPPLRGTALRALRREVAPVNQGLHLVPRLTARENVLIGALGRLAGWRSWARLPLAADIAEADSALDAVGLLAHAATRCDRLSGGERQKVAIARMLMQRPRLIVADEPTASLDPAAAQEICRLLVQAARQATLVSVVHSPALLRLLADRVIGLRQGRLLFDLPVAQVDEACLAELYRDASAPMARPAVSPTPDAALMAPSRA
ncbi:MAG: ATP-binding cassette domain-containing protein [Rubrivivax sp.]|nr:ATP-binding cassette domain-containing protein [Rubrivivax sp.]